MQAGRDNDLGNFGGDFFIGSQVIGGENPSRIARPNNLFIHANFFEHHRGGERSGFHSFGIHIGDAVPHGKPELAIATAPAIWLKFNRGSNILNPVIAPVLTHRHSINVTFFKVR